MGNEVNLVINNLCDKFGVTVDYLLPKISHYMFVMSLAGTIGCSFLFVICVAIIAVIVAHVDEWDEDVCGCVLIFTCIVGVTSMIFLVVNIYGMVSVIASPEVATFKYVMHMVR